MKRENREFKSIMVLARVRAVAVVRCVDVLLPDADERKKKRVCRKILSMCDGKDRSLRISEAQIEELVLQNWNCTGRECPACFFWEPLSRQLNAFFNEEE